MNAPIVMFVYNRVNHTKKLVESLGQNELSRQSSLFIFSDGYKNDSDKNAVLQVRDYIKSIRMNGIFREVTVYENSENMGLAGSVISGVNKILNQYDKVIVLEDDLVVSPYLLKFMNEALNYYQSDQNIWSVSGFSRRVPYLDTIKEDVYFSVRAQSWSWGTWRDRWQRVDWSVGDYRAFSRNLADRRRFNAGGNDMASMLDRQQMGVVNSWAIRFCYAQFRNSMYTVQPQKTLVVNEGQDGSGTNCGYLNEQSELSEKQSWRWRKFSNDIDINRELKKSRNKIPVWKLACSYLMYVILKIPLKAGR